MRVRAGEGEEEAEAVRSGVPGRRRRALGSAAARGVPPEGGGRVRGGQCWSAHRRLVVQQQLVVDLHLSGLLGGRSTVVARGSRRLGVRVHVSA
eukprot:scaffold6013_cov36-Phaeocystis_antarctica.AAC.1